MKNCFYFIFLFIGFNFLFNQSVNAQAQELVKPIPNKVGVKKGNNKVEPSSTTTSPNNQEQSSKTKFEEENSTPVVTTPKIVNDNPYNATRDVDVYQDKKAEWIKNNPEKYKVASGNPNLTILTEEQLNTYSSEEQARILSDEINYLIIR